MHADYRTGNLLVGADGEILAESGRYDRPEDMAGLTCGVVRVIVAWARFQRVDDLS